MSIDAEDETELRDLVTNSLQTSGVLGKIKAQLRSNVYLAIEGDAELKKKSQHVNAKLDSFAATSEGRLALQLIHEFLVFFNLDYTQLVYEPEALEGRDITIRDREKLIENLGFAGETLNPKAPLLTEVIKLSKVSILKSETPTLQSTSVEEDDQDTSEQSDILSSAHSSSRMPSKTPEKPDTNTNTTYTLTPNAFAKTAEEQIPPKSFLGDLPPLGSPSVPNPSKNLAPLKKIPPVAKVEATLKEGPDKAKPMVQVKPNTAEPEPQSISITEDIDEELDDFLNSSISASEDFTKEETVTEDASLKADYMEKL